MKRLVFLGLAVVLIALLCVRPALMAAGKEDKGKQKAATPAKSSKQQETLNKEREALAANINNMRNQELRVAVLQQLLNEEAVKMRSVQDSFCKEYKLDAEKFRQGLYRYDPNENKFVEVKPQERPKN